MQFAVFPLTVIRVGLWCNEARHPVKVAGAGSNPVRSIPSEDTAEGSFRVGGPVDGAWLSLRKSLIRRPLRAIIKLTLTGC